MAGANLNLSNPSNLPNNSNDFHHGRFQHIRTAQGNIAVPPHLEVRLQALFLVFMTQAQGQIHNPQQLAALQSRFQQALQEACGEHLQHPEISLQQCITQKIEAASSTGLTQVWAQVQSRWSQPLPALLAAQNNDQVYTSIASFVRQQVNQDRNFSRPTQEKELGAQLCEQLLSLVHARGGQVALDRIMDEGNGLRGQIGINEIVDSARRMTLVGANLQENIGVVLNQASSLISNRIGATLARRGFQVQSLAISAILGGLTGAIQGGGQIAMSYYSMNAEQRTEQSTRLLWELAKSVGVGVASGLAGYLGELAQQKLGLEHNWISNAVVFATTDVGSEVAAQIGLDRLGVRLHLEEERFFTGTLASNLLSNGLEEVVSAKVHGPLLRSPMQAYHWAGTYFAASDVEIPSIESETQIAMDPGSSPGRQIGDIPSVSLSLQRRGIERQGPLGLDVDALAAQVPHYLASPSQNGFGSNGFLNSLWQGLPSVEKHFSADNSVSWQMAGRTTTVASPSETARLDSLTSTIQRTVTMIQGSLEKITANTYALDRRLDEIQKRLTQSDVQRDREYLEDLKDASNILLNRLRALIRSQMAETAKEEQNDDAKKINLHRFFTEKVTAKVREAEIEARQQILDEEENIEAGDAASDVSPSSDPVPPKPPRPPRSPRVQEDVFGAPWKKGQKVPALVNIYNPEIDFSLRAHQWQMLANIDADWTRHLAPNERRQGVALAPTGSGKTRAMGGTIALGIAQGRLDFEKGDKAIIGTHLESIRDQNLGKIFELLNPIFRKKYGRDVIVSEVCGDSDDYSGDVVIVSVPKVGKDKSGFKDKLKSKLKPGARVGLTLLDEYHHGEADTWQRTRNDLAELGNGSHYELGFTATLPSDERANTNIVYELNFLEAMKKGIIPPLTLVELRTLISLAKVSVRGSGSKVAFNESELSQTVRNSARDIKIWSGFEAHGLRQKNGRPQPSLCTAVDIAHMDELARSYQIYSRTPVADRPPCVNDKGEPVEGMGFRNIAVLENPQKDDLKKLESYVAALQNRTAVNYQCYEFHSDTLKDAKNDRRYRPQSGTATTPIHGIAVTITGNTHPNVLKKVEEYASQGLIDIVFYVKKWSEGKDAWWARNTLAGRPWLSEIGSGQELGRLCRYGPDEVSSDGVIQQVVQRRALSFIDSSDAKRVLQTYARVMGLDLSKMSGKLGMPLDIVRGVFGAQGYGKLEIKRDANNSPTLNDTSLVEFPEATEVLRGSRSHLLIPDEQLRINIEKLPNVKQALKFREVFRAAPYNADLINFAFDLAITEEEAVGIMNAYLPMSDRLAERISTLAYQDRQRLSLSERKSVEPKVVVEKKDYSQAGAIEKMGWQDLTGLFGTLPTHEQFRHLIQPGVSKIDDVIATKTIQIKPDARYGFVVVEKGPIELTYKVHVTARASICIEAKSEKIRRASKEVRDLEVRNLIDRFYANGSTGLEFSLPYLGNTLEEIGESLANLSQLSFKRLFCPEMHSGTRINRYLIYADKKVYKVATENPTKEFAICIWFNGEVQTMYGNFDYMYSFSRQIAKNPLFKLRVYFENVYSYQLLTWSTLELNSNFDAHGTDHLEYKISADLGSYSMQRLYDEGQARSSDVVSLKRVIKDGNTTILVNAEKSNSIAKSFAAHLLLHPFAVNGAKGQTEPSEMDLKIKPLVLSWFNTTEDNPFTVKRKLETFSKDEKRYLAELMLVCVDAFEIKPAMFLRGKVTREDNFYYNLLPTFFTHFTVEEKVRILEKIIDRIHFQHPPSSVVGVEINGYLDFITKLLGNDQYLLLPHLLEKIRKQTKIDPPFFARYREWVSRIVWNYFALSDYLTTSNSERLKAIFREYERELNFTEGKFQDFFEQLKTRLSLM